MLAAHVRSALILVAAATAAAPLAHAADQRASAGQRGFEGRIQMRLMDTRPQGASYMVRGDRVRIDVPGLPGTPRAHAVVDFARHTFTTGNDASRQAATEPLPELGVASDSVTVRKGGPKRVVVGQACETWTLLDGGHTVEACVIPGVAWFDPRRVTHQDVPGWSRRLEVDRAFPVSVWEGDASGRTVFASWATDVTRGPVGDEVFAVPRTARRPPAGR